MSSEVILKPKLEFNDLLDTLDVLEDIPVAEIEPIEITEQIRDKLSVLMDTYLNYRVKLTKVNKIQKTIKTESEKTLKELETLMKFYNLKELIKDDNCFVIDHVVRKKNPGKAQLKQIIQTVINDQTVVDSIYATADNVSEIIEHDKVKCMKYKGSK